jgi:cell division protein FtsN
LQGNNAMAPRDYKNRRKGSKKAKSSRSWLWFVAGLLLGVAGTLFAEIQEYFSTESVAQAVREATSGDQHIAGGKVAAQEPAKKSPRPRFEFYTLLPEMEVAVPEAELAAQTSSPSRVVEKDDVTYVLQAGSFRKLAQADRLKAELALMGMPANIQTVSIEGGAKWHRVRVGPFTNLQALNEARTELQSNGLKVMVLKVRS